MARISSLTLLAAALLAVAGSGLVRGPAADAAGGVTVTVPVATNCMGSSSLTPSCTLNVDTTSHEQSTFPAACASGSLVVGGGSYLRNAASASTIPTNGLVLFGTMPSDGTGNALAGSATDPTSWTTVGGFSGVAEQGDESETFAMCESGGPASTVVAVASTVGTNATQEVSMPTVTTATCPGGDALLGGGAVESTPGQVNNGTTVNNNPGNVKPLASYPSNSSGVMASNGSTDPTSWSAYGSAGLPASTDTIYAFAVCSSDATFQPPVSVVEHDVPGPLGQIGTTLTSDTVTCASGQLIGGGYRVDETVSGTSGLQPQQGFHMRGSYPSNSTGGEVAGGTTDPAYWTTLLQAGGQNLGANNSMTLHTFALCQQAPLPVPTLGTQASASVPLGGSISDTATIGGGTSPTGSITFDLYGPNPSGCTGTPEATSTVTVNGNGQYQSANVTPSASGSYEWVASYGGDSQNGPVSGSCGDANESTVVQAVPTLTTSASSGSIGSPITDSATLSGGTNPTGTISFALYGPSQTTCSGTPVATSSVTVSGNAMYTSSSYTPTADGTYRWIASYGGDSNNAATGGSCSDANESVTIAATTPSLSTSASVATLGSTMTDTAMLAGGSNPTGTIVFGLYGPADPSCTATPVAASTVPVSGNGSYTSGSYAPTAAGTYHWIAHYSGDSGNSSVTGSCSDANESTTVAAATPTLATVASAVSVGGAVTDTATLTGGFDPAGSIVFDLYGAGDGSCSSAPVFTSNQSVQGNGATSAPFTPTVAGIYHWVASYGGDGANAAIAGHCGDGGESVTVSIGTPTLSTSASGTAPIGGALLDHAALTGGLAPTGTFTFSLYGPNDPTCANAPVFTDTEAVGAGESAHNAPYTATAAGAYEWIASYSGDASNAAVTGHCTDSGESVMVTKLTPTLATTPSGTVGVGGTLLDHASLSGGSNPSGNLTFVLYGPNDPSCSNAPAFTDTEPVVASNGDGNHSNPFTATATGTYEWVVTYAGDANNTSVAASCGAESTTVTTASTGGNGGSATSSSSTSSSTSTAGTTGNGSLTPPATGGSGKAIKGKTGSLTIGSGAGQVIASWTAAGLAPGTVTVTLTPGAPASSTAKFSAGTNAVVISVVDSDGDPVTEFSSPLDLEFPNIPAGAIPAYSEDGVNWIAIPKVPSPPALPAGWGDGWYRDSVGTLHILTRHSTYYGALKRGGKVTAALTFTAHAAASGRKVTVSVKPTLPAKLTVELTRRGAAKILASRSWKLGSTGARTLTFKLPASAAAGKYSVLVEAAAGSQTIAETAEIAVR